MRKLLLCSFLCAMTTLLADDVIVIQSKGGRAYAVNTSNIDSIYFDSKGKLPDNLFNLGDTVMIHDTVTVTKNIINNVYNDTKCVQSIDAWHFNIENPSVSGYMNAVDYSGSENDYSYTKITDYVGKETDYVKSHPAGVIIKLSDQWIEPQIILSFTKDFSICEDTIHVASGSESYTVDNLYPNKMYYYRVMADGEIVEESHFCTIGQVRMMNLPSINNVRDLGGWKTEDGKTVKYGRIYRGAELNRPETLFYVYNHQISSADSMYMVDKMKIRLEIDLRADRDMGLDDTISTNNTNFSAIGVEYYNQQVHYYNQYMKYPVFRQRWANCISKLVKCLKEDKNCYFHCTWGADRAGTMSMLILGTLGVPQADLDKEYELTSFSVLKTRSSSEKDYWSSNMQYIKTLNGSTLKDKFASYLRGGGVTQQEIDDLRSIMLE